MYVNCENICNYGLRTNLIKAISSPTNIVFSDNIKINDANLLECD